MSGRGEQPKVTYPVVEVAQMLTVTSRGIGIACAKHIQRARVDSLAPKPHIYTLYRIYLGLLEAKVYSLEPHYPLIPQFTDKIYCPKDKYRLVEVFKYVNFVPKSIKIIIDSIRIVKDTTYGTYLPIIADVKRDEEGKLVPSPANTVLSNLRETVMRLADPDTPLEVRTAYEAHCPIPGAIWHDHILENPDDIIPNDYNYDEHLHNDIMNISNQMSRTFPRYLEVVKLNRGFEGSKSILVCNELQGLRICDRKRGEDLNEYYSRICIEGDIRRYFCRHKLTNTEWAAGMVSLLGEKPADINTETIYAHRDPLINTYHTWSNTFTGIYHNLCFGL